MENNNILIDRYLQNEMSGEERVAFEKQLVADKNLKEEFQQQQQIVRAATDAGIKNEFTKAIRRRMITRRIQWGIVGAIAAGAFIFYAVTSGLFSRHSSAETKAKGIEASERFEIDNASDTIIETRDGVVFAIPAHAFKGSDQVQLEVRTALTPYDIMEKGLSTYSNDALLQTAGMFYINGYKNGKPLELVKDIAVSVPAVQVNPKMQLFDGVEDKDGKVNWVNPKPIEKKLRTYDITTLDFYPPNYIPVLKTLNKNYRDKKYTDSLYYSFSGYPHYAKTDTAAVVAPAINIIDKERQAPDTGGKLTDSTIKSDYEHIGHDHSSYEIDPARIGAIWNEKFNNTIIATKEFEERLRYMHSICNGHRFLEVYLKNLDTPLYVSDEICARLGIDENSDAISPIQKQFLAFAARKDGTVLIARGMQQQLSDYFQKKYTAYQEAALETWQKHEAELERLQLVADTRRTEKAIADLEREEANFEQEFCINLTDAYRQIGVQRSCNDTIVPPPATYYNFTINITGWKNLDMYVFDATTTRESMNYTDPVTGKTASLSYKQMTVRVEDQSSFDRVLVYLIPDSLSSFQRVEQSGDLFKENLNSLFRYDLVVLGYRGDEIFYYRQQSVPPGNHSIHLAPVTQQVLRSILRNYNKINSKEWKEEFEYQLAEQQELKRVVQLRKDREFREMIASAIFSCWEGALHMAGETPVTPSSK